jgi:hypothetical protein
MIGSHCQVSMEVGNSPHPSGEIETMTINLCSKVFSDIILKENLFHDENVFVVVWRLALSW